MGKQYAPAELAIYWFDMYKAQDFDLTMQELMGIWGLATKSAVSYRLIKMFELGLVKRRKAGTTYVYRAKHEQEIDWIRFYGIGDDHVNKPTDNSTDYSADWDAFSRDFWNGNSETEWASSYLPE